MKIEFNGIKESVRGSGGGCGCCGARRTPGTSRIRTHKELSLPSGRFQVFRINQVSEVLDSDGEWLLREYGDAFQRVEKAL